MRLRVYTVPVKHTLLTSVVSGTLLHFTICRCQKNKNRSWSSYTRVSANTQTLVFYHAAFSDHTLWDTSSCGDSVPSMVAHCSTICPSDTTLYLCRGYFPLLADPDIPFIRRDTEYSLDDILRGWMRGNPLTGNPTDSLQPFFTVGDCETRTIMKKNVIRRIFLDLCRIGHLPHK